MFRTERYFQLDNTENGRGFVVEIGKLFSIVAALWRKFGEHVPFITYKMEDPKKSQETHFTLRRTIMDAASYIGAEFVFQLDDNLEQA